MPDAGTVLKNRANDSGVIVYASSMHLATVSSMFTCIFSTSRLCVSLLNVV